MAVSQGLPVDPPSPRPALPGVRIPGYGSWGWLTFPVHPGSSHLPDTPIELKLRRGTPGVGQLLQHHVLEIWGAG